MADEAIREIGQNGDAHRAHDLPVPAHDLEVGEAEHALDFLGGQPRLGRLPVLEAESLGEPQQRLPETAVAVDHHAGPRVAEGVEALERRLHVRKMGHHVDEQDDVEGSADRGEELPVGHVALEELETRATV